MNLGGVDTSKVQVLQHQEGMRGLYATCDIKKDEVILFVPDRYILCSERIIDIPQIDSIIKMIEKRKLKNVFGELIVFAIYILLEMRKPSHQREFGPYFDIFPTDFRQFPLWFAEEELELLKGSPILDYIKEGKNAIEEAHKMYCKEIAELKDCKLEKWK